MKGRGAAARAVSFFSGSRLAECMEPPPEPTPRQERVLLRLLHAFYTSSLQRVEQDPAPAAWEPLPLGIRREAGGVLAAILFPVPSPRGIVLFGHPGIPPAKGYFHRSDRIPFVQSLGFSALTFDHGGFGESDAATRLYHAEWADVLAWARRRFPGVPVATWGVSLGGYFLHHALARDTGVHAAIFEEVSPHLLHYRGDARSATQKLGAALAGRLPGATWFPAENHALHVRADHVLYLNGARDHGIPRDHARRLVAAAGPLAQHHVVDGAGHLESWKLGGDAVRAAVGKTLLG